MLIRRSGRGEHGGRRSSPRSGFGPASQVPPSMRARSAMPTSPYPDAGRDRMDRFPVVADAQAYRAVVGGDEHPDPGGPTGVPAGVGDGLLGQAVDRGLDRRR